MCDWTETDIFFRGSQEIIGAMKMDEKYLEEIRNQEKIMNELNASNNISDENSDNEAIETTSEPIPEPVIKPPSGQSTLFGGEQ